MTLMEDIRNNPNEAARKIYNFLSISEVQNSKFLLKKSNPSFIPRNRLLYDIANNLRGLSTKIGLRSAWDSAGNVGLRRLYRIMNTRHSEFIAPPSDKTIHYLRGVFKEEIIELQSILNINLEKWL